MLIYYSLIRLDCLRKTKKSHVILGGLSSLSECHNYIMWVSWVTIAVTRLVVNNRGNKSESGETADNCRIKCLLGIKLDELKGLPLTFSFFCLLYTKRFLKLSQYTKLVSNLTLLCVSSRTVTSRNVGKFYTVGLAALLSGPHLQVSR